MPLQQKIGELAAQPVPPNEESAKAYAVYPILQLLGWHTYDRSQVAFDQPVGSGRVDFVLQSRGRAVAYLVTKAPGTPLPHVADRVLRYASRGEASIVAVTTGVEWRFHLADGNHGGAQLPFAALDVLKDPPETVAETLRCYLGRDELASGGAAAGAKAALAAARNEQRTRVELPKVWDEMVSTPDPELVSLVQRRVLSKTGLEAKASLVAELLGKGQLVRSASGSAKVPIARRDGQRLTPRTPRPTSFRLWGTEVPVKSWRDVLLGVMQALHRRHEAGFLEAARPLWGGKKPWISEDRSQIQRCGAIPGTRLYAFVNLPIVAIKERCGHLLKHFGYDADDLVVVSGAEVSRPAAPRRPTAGDADATAEPWLVLRRIRSPGSKPASWSLWGNETWVNAWVDVLVGVFEAVHSRHEAGFLDAAQPLWGGRKPWMSTDPTVFKKRPRPIGDTGLHINVDLPAAVIYERCRNLLQRFGHDPDELTITLREPAGTGDSPPPKPEPRRTRRRRRWR